MSRPVRLEFEGAVYHVPARGNERREIFRDDRDREKYLERLRHYRERFGFRLLAFCLMSNHSHLVIETGRTPLRASCWASRAHIRSGSTGDIAGRGTSSQGRYKAFLVEQDALVARETGRVPLARTAAYFARDGSTLVRNVALLELELSENPARRRTVDAIMRRV